MLPHLASSAGAGGPLVPSFLGGAVSLQGRASMARGREWALSPSLLLHVGRAAGLTLLG